jgi:hypothetical protein
VGTTLAYFGIGRIGAPLACSYFLQKHGHSKLAKMAPITTSLPAEAVIAYAQINWNHWQIPSGAVPIV